MKQSPAVVDFCTSYVRNIGALMSGAISVPFAYWGLFQAPDSQKTLFLILAFVSFISSTYLMWVGERKQVIAALEKLAKVGSKFSLVYENAELNFDLKNSIIKVGLKFRNVGEEMLVYEIGELLFYINGIGTKIQPGNSKTHIHAGGEMLFHFDVNGMPNIDFSQPTKIRIGCAAQYDNVVPIRRRFTKRHIEFEYRSLIPLCYSHNTVTETEEGFL